MSFFEARVIQLPEPVDHPNADNLFLFNLEDPVKATVIGNKDSWRGVKRAVYCLPDSVLPDTPEYEWLGSSRRVKPKKLRNIFSYGLLLPASDEWLTGQDVKDIIGIKKWEEPAEKFSTDSDTDSSPRGEVKYTDIESLKRYPNLFQLHEPVILMEKLHGANSRFVFQDGRVYMGSRTRWVKDSGNLWSKAFHQTRISKVIESNPDLIFFAEAIGQVQDLKYGRDLDLVYFDIFDISKGKYYDFHELRAALTILELPMAPILYRGPWLEYEEMLKYAEGKSTLADHVLEGFVARPLMEQYSDELGGRKIIKLAGEGYHLRKQK